ncbi:hypothetical protein [Gemmata sp.]|uniref:hypothetical protein n=1 Tax=Gemmata sp. TaxID=1914242 RepID=UPI003F6FF3D9
MDTGNPKSFRPAVVQLEAREVPAVASVQLVGGVLTVQTNDESSNVAVSQTATNINVRDSVTNQVWNYARAQVSVVNMFGGAGNDSFTSKGNAGVYVGLYGKGGDDVLDGNAGPNTLIGGPGNDRLFGRGGADLINGGAGNDFIFGGLGNDVLNGQGGADTVNGGQGIDAITGGPGNDVLVSIDGTNLDTVDAGGGGEDILWIDNVGGVQEAVTGITAEDLIRPVAAFANGADLTLTGDRIPLPDLLSTFQRYETFTNRPLFAAGGPTLSDVNQTASEFFFGTFPVLDDSTLLASLGAMLDAFPNLIKSNVVDFGDGTYGARINGTFYRVDNRLPVAAAGDVVPTYAGVGADNSLWVAVIEKVVATATSTVNPSYSFIDGTITASQAFQMFGARASDVSNVNLPGVLVDSSQLGNIIQTALNRNNPIVFAVSTGSFASGLSDGQTYTITGLTFDTQNNVAGVVMRNAAGRFDTDNPPDGVLTVAIDDLFNTDGTLTFANFDNV